MKLAVFLILLGGSLIVDGSWRIVEGIMISRASMVVGGIFTGIILGIFVLNKGIKRYKSKMGLKQGNEERL